MASLLAATVPVLGGCLPGPMSALDPAGPAALEIATLWWVMFWASAALVLLMTGLGLYAACRRPERRARVSSKLLIFGGGLALPSAAIVALLIYGIRAGHSLLAVPLDDAAYRVEVTAHQWWWEVAYPDGRGGRLYSANEVHVPAGRPVDVHLRSADVIHGFWVPRLGGKMDAIPGITNVIRLSAFEPGVYRGQCAEFCGAQHARMRLTFEAHAEEDLERRLAALAAAGPPAEATGAADFQAACGRCHAVRPGERSLEPGPNLADLAFRRELGAGTIPNEEGALERWLVAHQRLKPENRMPAFDDLDTERRASIVRYLEGGR